MSRKCPGARPGQYSSPVVALTRSLAVLILPALLSATTRLLLLLAWIAPAAALLLAALTALLAALTALLLTALTSLVLLVVPAALARLTLVWICHFITPYLLGPFPKGQHVASAHGSGRGPN